MLAPGTVVASRFVVEAQVGRGGMGVVFLARDERRGERVALKLLDAPDADDARRFAHESEVLARLDHPAVVDHVAHGVDEEGRLYLAMEWLEGEDLAGRLRRGPLPRDEVLAMTIRLADALGVAHEAGIVHRDVKPSNVFLPGSDPNGAKLLDFGIAFRAMRSTRMTVEGVLVGTPGYLAPEQIRSEAVDARADVFSLGCLLYECLAHRRAFPGDDAMAVMGRILLDPVLRLSDVVDDEVAEELEELVDRMLAKERSDRPVDMGEVRESLRSLGAEAMTQLAERGTRASFLTGDEQRFLAILAVGAPSELESGATWTPPRADDRRRSLEAVADAHRVRLEVLPDGSAVGAVLGDPESAHLGQVSAAEIAARAARLALDVEDLAGVGRVAVVVGRGVVGQALPVGLAIDRAVALLERGPGEGIRIGPDAAALLGPSFEVEATPDVRFLLRERDVTLGFRRICGRPAPFVGRDDEIDALARAYRGVITTGRAELHLVVGAAGIGKSRLVGELLARLLDVAPLRLIALRGAPRRSRSPLSALAPAVRASIGVRASDGPLVAKAKILASLVRALGAEHGPPHAPFLGELAGVPFEDVRATLDPRIVGDRMREAFAAWLGGLARTQPVVVLVDDLSVVDRASARMVDDVVEMLRDRAIFFLATARDLGEELARHSPIVHRLEPLADEAARGLVRALSGEGSSASDVERIASLGMGHPFYLEELVRARLAGEDELPDTVLASVEARMSHLDDECRRVLRAASVFGERFTPSDVRALLPEEARPGVVEVLERLAAADLLVRGTDGTHTFSRGLVRDAAYATLTPVDRARGHRRAAEWLEESGRAAPAILAAHWAEGERPERAAPFDLEAARRALEADDLRGALELSERGFAHADGPRIRGELRTVAAEAHLWRGEALAAREAALAARSMLASTSPRHAHATAVMADASLVLGATSTVRELAVELSRDGRADSEWIDSALRVAMATAMAGDADAAETLLERASSFGEAAPSGRLAQARAVIAGARGDVGRAVELRIEAAVAFEAAGAMRLATMEWMNTAGRLIEIGAFERARTLLESACESSERAGLRYHLAFGIYSLGVLCSQRLHLAEAQRFLQRAAELYARDGDRRLEAAATYELALVALRDGRALDARRSAARACELLGGMSSDLAPALAILAAAHLEDGQVPEALDCSARALEILEREDVDDRRAFIRLIRVQALSAAGRDGDAREVRRAAVAELERQARAVGDDELRRLFWQEVPEHRALRAWESR